MRFLLKARKRYLKLAHLNPPKTFSGLVDPRFCWLFTSKLQLTALFL